MNKTDWIMSAVTANEMLKNHKYSDYLLFMQYLREQIALMSDNPPDESTLIFKKVKEEEAK